MQKCKMVTYSQNKNALIFSSFLIEVICFAPSLSHGQVWDPALGDALNFTRVWEALSPQRDAGLLVLSGVREAR